MAETEKEKVDELEVIETDDNGKPVGAEGETDKGDEGQGDDRKLSAEAEDEKADETPIVNDPEREKLRVERRLRRKIQKELKRDAQAAERLELEELRRTVADQNAKIAAIQTNQSAGVEETLKTRLRNAVAVYNKADEDVGLAIEAGNGAAAREALKARDDAKDTAQQLDLQIRRLAAKPTAPMGPDPIEAKFYSDWTKANPWFDPKLSNQESRIARQINDDLISKDGYKANTEAFWKELSSRVNKFVKPAKEEADGDDDKPKERRANGGPPVGGGGREAPPTNGKTRVYISPARKQAMVEAGIWDDQEARTKMLRAYSKYDRAQTETQTNAR